MPSPAPALDPLAAQFAVEFVGYCPDGGNYFIVAHRVGSETTFLVERDHHEPCGWHCHCGWFQFRRRPCRHIRAVQHHIGVAQEG